jgi:hypothetical protein
VLNPSFLFLFWFPPGLPNPPLKLSRTRQRLEAEICEAHSNRGEKFRPFAPFDDVKHRMKSGSAIFGSSLIDSGIRSDTIQETFIQLRTLSPF